MKISEKMKAEWKILSFELYLISNHSPTLLRILKSMSPNLILIPIIVIRLKLYPSRGMKSFQTLYVDHDVQF